MTRLSPFGYTLSRKVSLELLIRVFGSVTARTYDRLADRLEKRKARPRVAPASAPAVAEPAVAPVAGRSLAPTP